MAQPFEVRRRTSASSAAGAARLLLALAAVACGRDRLVAIDTRTYEVIGTGGSAANASSTHGAAGSLNFGQTSSPQPPECGRVGSQCSGNESCCSKICFNGVCMPLPTCGNGGDSCNSAVDCCSGVCGEDGRCPYHSGCLLIGESCETPANCCSAACSDNGTGRRTCQPLDGCRATGEKCTRSGPGECCSESCVYDTSARFTRCAAAANPTCLGSGEICGTDGRPCCDSSATCYLTGTGVSRCALLPQDCPNDGAPCRMASDCCSHFCLPRPDGQLACAPGCATFGAACRGSRDCCMPSACTSSTANFGTCQVLTFCRQLGQPCDNAEECCSGNCSGTSQSCVVP
jgi:hypothetical protein